MSSQTSASYYSWLRQKKASSLLPHLTLRKSKKLCSSAFSLHEWKDTFQYSKTTWFLLLANSCLKSRYSVVKCGYFKRCLLAQDMLLTSVRLWSTPIKTHNFNLSWINSLNRVCVFTFNAALLGSIRRACCAAQASCYWFDYDGQSDIQFTRYQATTLSNLKRIYFNYLESRVWWKK